MFYYLMFVTTSQRKNENRDGRSVLFKLLYFLISQMQPRKLVVVFINETVPFSRFCEFFFAAFFTNGKFHLEINSKTHWEI